MQIQMQAAFQIVLHIINNGLDRFLLTYQNKIINKPHILHFVKTAQSQDKIIQKREIEVCELLRCEITYRHADIRFCMEKALGGRKTVP